MFKKPSSDSGLEKAIEQVYSEMQGYSADQDEFAAMVDQLVKLHAIKTDNNRPRVSPDTWATIAAHLVGITIIVGHERTHIVTSKALSFVQKLR